MICLRIELHSPAISNKHHGEPMATTGITHNQVNQILVRIWQEPDYKARLIKQPGAALAEMGVQLPKDRTIFFTETGSGFSVRESGGVFHVSLPDMPPDTELSDDELEQITAGVRRGDDEGQNICFLTTCVTRLRGEADDGPTLTALRAFRDNYMTSDPNRVQLVMEYYRDAPRIAAAIPRNHSDWEWMADRIDLAANAASAGHDEAAFRIYADMFQRMRDTWAPLPVRRRR